MSLMQKLALWGQSSVGLPRIAEVGYIIDTQQAGFIWNAPQRVTREESANRHSKSLRYCPAMLEHEARLFEITCPIDLKIKLAKDDKTGNLVIKNLAGPEASLRSSHLKRMLHLVPPHEWRHPNRPVIQISTPYLFVADEPIWVTQMPPITHYNPTPWPGVLSGGRFPIDVWPRHLMWAMEWHDPMKELVLRRGEPWFQCRFETMDPSRPVKLIEAEITPALREQINGASAVTNYVSRTFSLFNVARERRPKKLLRPKRHD